MFLLLVAGQAEDEFTFTKKKVDKVNQLLEAAPSCSISTYPI